jgi:hypothetical protein
MNLTKKIIGHSIIIAGFLFFAQQGYCQRAVNGNIAKNITVNENSVDSTGNVQVRAIPHESQAESHWVDHPTAEAPDSLHQMPTRPMLRQGHPASILTDGAYQKPKAISPVTEPVKN